MAAERRRRTPPKLKRPEEYLALSELRQEDGWPSRAALFAIVTRHRIRAYKFEGDRKTYVRRADLENALATPVPRSRSR